MLKENDHHEEGKKGSRRVVGVDAERFLIFCKLRQSKRLGSCTSIILRKWLQLFDRTFMFPALRYVLFYSYEGSESRQMMSKGAT